MNDTWGMKWNEHDYRREDNSNAMKGPDTRQKSFSNRPVENRRDDPEYTDSTCPEKKGPDTVLCRS